MVANPEFDMERHDPEDSRTKFAYYFSLAEPDNGGLMRFHPGGFSREREITVEFHRWHREFLNDIAAEVGSRQSGTNRSSARRAWHSMGRRSSRTTSPTRKAHSCD